MPRKSPTADESAVAVLDPETLGVPVDDDEPATEPEPAAPPAPAPHDPLRAGLAMLSNYQRGEEERRAAELSASRALYVAAIKGELPAGTTDNDVAGAIEHLGKSAADVEEDRAAFVTWSQKLGWIQRADEIYRTGEIRAAVEARDALRKKHETEMRDAEHRLNTARSDAMLGQRGRQELEQLRRQRPDLFADEPIPEFPIA